MESVWYFVAKGVQSGPVSWAELKEAAARGKFSDTDLVWKDGTPDWVPARTIAGLFPVASPPLPPSGGTPSQVPLSLDDEPGPVPKRRRERADDPEIAAAPMPEWVKLIQVFLRRTFNPDPSNSMVQSEEDAALTRAGVLDPTARKFAVWRRGVLFVSAVPCSFAALFGLIRVIAMDNDDREGLSNFGVLVLFVQALALFALPVAAVFGALAYDRLASSARWVLIGGLISFGVPLGVAFIPGSWLIDLKTDANTLASEVEAARSMIGIILGVQFYLILMPAVLSLLPAIARACVRMKMLLPQSLVPGWGLVTSSPLCVLLTLATFVLVYHMVGNALLILGLLMWVGAPLLYLTRFNLLTRPIQSPADRAALAQTSLMVVGIILSGVLFLIIFLFTATFMGKNLMGFSSTSSHIRPWSIDLHKLWIEYFGRALFLSVFFGDLILRMMLSIWREDRAFAASPEVASFDHTMSGLGAAVLPRGNPTPAG